MSDFEATAAEVTRLAHRAEAAVRGINHQTITGPALPAPCVYEVLGALKRVGYGLDQATGQLASRLEASAAVFDLYEFRGGDPAASIASATAALTEAAGHAEALGRLLDAAQSAIAGQGYNP
jgi:hypothetical protein